VGRKRKPEEYENLERWLVSYADFITLLFAFFVVMYAVSSINEGKYRVLSDALVAAFRSPVKSLEPIQIGTIVRSPYVKDASIMQTPRLLTPMPIPVNKPPFELPMRVERRKPRPKAAVRVPVGEYKSVPEVMRDIANQIEKAMESLIQKDLIIVRRDELWIEVEIRNSILFASGSAALEPEAIPVLESIAEILQQFPNAIQVEGFTDNVPISTVAFPSNWELSAARAASVVHLFTKLGIRPDRMAAIGYGEHRPNADNATPEGRQKNRRVVLVVLASPDIERLLAIRQAALIEEKPAEKPDEKPEHHGQPVRAPGDVKDDRAHT
jgi:chemotaxis protein MotB